MTTKALIDPIELLRLRECEKAWQACYMALSVNPDTFAGDGVTAVAQAVAEIERLRAMREARMDEMRERIEHQRGTINALRSQAADMHKRMDTQGENIVAQFIAHAHKAQMLADRAKAVAHCESRMSELRERMSELRSQAARERESARDALATVTQQRDDMISAYDALHAGSTAEAIEQGALRRRVEGALRALQGDA